MTALVVSDDQRMEYNQLMDQVQKMTQELDSRLPMYWIVLRSDDMIRRLVAIVSALYVCLHLVTLSTFFSGVNSGTSKDSFSSGVTTGHNRSPYSKEHV